MANLTLELLRQKDSLPISLRPFITEEYQPLSSVPESFNLAGTELGARIDNFGTVVTRVYDHLPPDKWLEAYQNGYLVDGKLRWGPISKGGDASASLILKTKGEPRTDLKRVYIHSHPTSQTFSGRDLTLLSICKNPKVYYGNTFILPLPNLRAQILRVRTGDVFIALATQETPSISKQEAIEGGMDTGGLANEVMKQKLWEIWQNLKQLYYLPEQSIGRNTREISIFPTDATERGIELIQLTLALEISRKLRTPIFRRNGQNVYRRITSVKDCFPNLLEK